ncbi:MAG: dipeptidase PepV [Lachnospiraceae bacterium]|nr:dipeptidase PepV [Lachnospiraceae bacterium]
MLKEKIDAFIEEHKEEMIEDICELCGINSEKMPAEEDMPFGPGAAECLDTALDIAEGYGFDVQDYDGYVGCVDLNELPRQLDILAHLDVVPAGEGWTVTEPFAPLVKDGKLYGRGTADDKGPAVAALYAMRAVKELKIPLKKNVRLILGTDEECGSSDIRHYYSVEKEAPMTFSPDGEYPVVNVEKGRLPGHFTTTFAPSDALPKLVHIKAGTKINVVPGKAKAMTEGLEMAALETAAKAVEAETGIAFTFAENGTQIEITAVGTGAHASLPQEGNNALTGLLTLLVKLPFAECGQIAALKKVLGMMPHGDVNGKTLGVEMEDEMSGELTLAFSMLTVDAGSLDGEFDSRVPVCGNEANVLNVIKKNMADQGVSLLNDQMTPPHHVSGDSEFVKTLLRAYETFSGQKGECMAIGGGTYVHNLENGVAFGATMPGTDNKMHGADEFAVIEELVMSAKIFAQAIVDLCS